MFCFMEIDNRFTSEAVSYSKRFIDDIDLENFFPHLLPYKELMRGWLETAFVDGKYAANKPPRFRVIDGALE
jgi:hypothetical protein